MPVVTRSLRILVLPEQPLRRGESGELEPDARASSGWVAVCLDHFIAAGGETQVEACQLLEVSLRAEIEDALNNRRTPFSGIKPAPERYQRLWSSEIQALPPSTPDTHGDLTALFSKRLGLPVEPEVRFASRAA